MPQVFFSRCKPQGCDIAELCVKEDHVFFGWPAWRLNATPEQGKLSTFMYDPQENWRKEDIDGYSPQHAKNRRLAKEIKEDDIVLIPRPSHGCVYAGYVKEFVFYDNPPLASKYLKLRESLGNSEKAEHAQNAVSYYFKHVPDVAQGWKVKGFERIPYAAIPRWILASALGRSTYGRIREHPLGGCPYPIMQKLIDNPACASLPFTGVLDEIKERLVNHLSPAMFEQLSVDLLQLENPHERWMHVGGSGDDGMDGLGFDDTGKNIGRLQCKLYWHGGVDTLFNTNGPVADMQDYFTTLSEVEEKNNGMTIWDVHRIAELVRSHAEHLPMALSLRIRG